MDVEAGLRAFDRDAIAGPDARLEVHVAFVLLGRLLARLRKAEFRVRAVLRGMISADLIIGPAVGGTQIDVLVLVALKTEGDSNETACAAAGARGGTPRQFHFDRPVVKGGPFHNRVGLAMGNLAVFGNLDGAFAEVIDGLQFYLMRNQLIYALSGHERRDREGERQGRAKRRSVDPA